MEFQQQQAIYLQIADLLCERILRGELKPKDKIPSIRELAVSIEVNPNTVVRTYNDLEEKNIISKQRGVGYFVTENAKEKIIKLRKDSFMKKELPRFFKTLDLLGINLNELENLRGETNEDKQ